MKRTAAFLFSIVIACSAFSSDVAVFPAIGINVDQSYLSAFSTLLAMKYAAASNQRVLSPRESAKALEPDSNFHASAQALDVQEYLVIKAIGLYISRKEKATYDVMGGEKKITVNIKADNNHSANDKKLLDDHKTIVTIVRHNAADGSEIYRAQMTLVTYGDIEESTERMAQSIFQKIPPEKTRTPSTITRAEGVQNNKLFQEKISGIKMGGIYTTIYSSLKLSAMISIGYNMKMESDNFFAEFGAGALLPSGFLSTKGNLYGGNYFEIAVSRYITDHAFPVFVGGGVVPYFNWLSDFQLGIMPFLHIGLMSSRAYRTRFFTAFALSQNVLPVQISKHTETGNTTIWGDPETVTTYQTAYPTQFNFQFGIGW